MVAGGCMACRILSDRQIFCDIFWIYKPCRDFLCSDVMSLSGAID